MKRIIVAIVLVLLIISVNAQKSYLGINLGTSIPGTDMSGNDELLNKGFAVRGFSIEFDGVYFPGSVIGVGAMLGFGSYYTQQDAYFDNIGDYINGKRNGVWAFYKCIWLLGSRRYEVITKKS